MFPVNTHRFDPYKNFKFVVKWDGRPVAGVSKVSALKRSTEPVSHRVGGDASSNRLSPSSWKFEPITLERGITHDPDFEAWANLAFSTDGDAAMSLKEFRKSITIDLLNLQGAVVLSYNVFRCWVSEYQAVPELDANANAVAIEMMVLQNEGWTRDLAVTEPTET
jgi:phage tail-like protein